MTTAESLFQWAKLIEEMSTAWAALMKDEIMYELPRELAEAIDRAGDEIANVGEILVKYAPKQEDK